MDRMKDLRRSLCEGQFIDKGTLEEHFCFGLACLTISLEIYVQ